MGKRNSFKQQNDGALRTGGQTWASGVFGVLQRIGRSLMLPIALLPVAGLLLGIGDSFTNSAFITIYKLDNVLGPRTPLYAIFNIMGICGGFIFDNLPLIFAMGIAIGMAQKEKEVAALAAAVGFFTMTAATSAMVGVAKGHGVVFINGQLSNIMGLEVLDSGVFGGIIVGLGTAALHNKYHRIELPPALAFFGGSRFVPIVTALVFLGAGVVMFFVWPVIQHGLAAAGNGEQRAGLAGTFIFGVVKRALIPFGLHHVWYAPFWYTEVGGTWDYFPQAINAATGALDPNGVHYINSINLSQAVKDAIAGGALDPQDIAGGQRMFFHQLEHMSEFKHFDSDATQYFSGEFIFMMFGYPGAALAMYHCAKTENKRIAGGLLLSAALTSFFTGITEPIEFSFLFAAPLLFVVSVVLGGLAYTIAHALNVGVGLTFSGGFIDLVLFGIIPGNAKTSWLWIPVVGVVYFFLYYGIFRLLIIKFNFKTPGREDEGDEIKRFTKSDYQAKQNANKGGGKSSDDSLSAAIIAGLGGRENIRDLDCCATRLRLTVNDPSKVMPKVKLKNATGANGVITSGAGIQIIFGPRVTIVKANLEDYLAR